MLQTHSFLLYESLQDGLGSWLHACKLHVVVELVGGLLVPDKTPSSCMLLPAGSRRGMLRRACGCLMGAGNSAQCYSAGTNHIGCQFQCRVICLQLLILSRQGTAMWQVPATPSVGFTTWQNWALVSCVLRCPQVQSLNFAWGDGAVPCGASPTSDVARAQPAQRFENSGCLSHNSQWWRRPDMLAVHHKSLWFGPDGLLKLRPAALFAGSRSQRLTVNQNSCSTLSMRCAQHASETTRFCYLKYYLS